MNRHDMRIALTVVLAVVLFIWMGQCAWFSTAYSGGFAWAMWWCGFGTTVTAALWLWKGDEP